MNLVELVLYVCNVFVKYVCNLSVVILIGCVLVQSVVTFDDIDMNMN